MILIGYARVSTINQNEDRQIQELIKYGVEEKRIYIDKQSGKDFHRPSYMKMLKRLKKGDVLGVARVAGIMGVKRTSELIPMCHPLPIQKCSVDFETDEDAGVIRVFCTVKTEGKTGVEMEALTGVQVALLTIYDMCKAIDKRMVMSDIHLEEKTGGKSGDFRFEEK